VDRTDWRRPGVRDHDHSVCWTLDRRNQLCTAGPYGISDLLRVATWVGPIPKGRCGLALIGGWVNRANAGHAPGRNRSAEASSATAIRGRAGDIDAQAGERTWVFDVADRVFRARAAKGSRRA